MPVVIGWLINFLPLIWYIVSKLPILNTLTSMSGKAGLFAKICGLLVSAYWFIRRLPIAFLKVKLGSGILGRIFLAIRTLLNCAFNFPVIVVFTLFMSQYFPSLLEHLFLIVGAIALKIGISIFSKVMSAMDTVSNMDTLNTVIGNSADQLPPCMLDVLAYMHVVEDLGLIITTAVVVMTYNLVTTFAFKFVK